MALNATAIGAADAFREILSKAKQMKSATQTLRALFVASAQPADLVINLLNNVRTMKDALNSNKTQAGLNAYAKTMYDNPALDFVAEVNSVVAACDTLMAWVVTNFPKDANGYLLKDKIVNNALEPRSLSTAATAGLVAEMDALVAAL